MCYKPYSDNDVRSLPFNGYSSVICPGVYVDERAYALLKACGQLAERVCNDNNICEDMRRQRQHTSFMRCCDLFAAFVGYRPTNNEDNRGRLGWRTYEKFEDRHTVVIITPDHDGLSFFWVAKSYDPDTHQMSEKAYMVGGCIFHPEYLKNGQQQCDANGLRGVWSIHT